jgi:hypothetical protein
MLKPDDGPTIVAILGEDSVVGNALESLLRFADYGARFFPGYPAEPLEGARVALILPISSTRRGEALITRIKSHPATANIRVIELVVTPSSGERNGHIRLPWPSSLEELKLSIEAALPEDSGTHPPAEI